MSEGDLLLVYASILFSTASIILVSEDNDPLPPLVLGWLVVKTISELLITTTWFLSLYDRFAYLALPFVLNCFSVPLSFIVYDWLLQHELTYLAGVHCLYLLIYTPALQKYYIELFNKYKNENETKKKNNLKADVMSIV